MIYVLKQFDMPLLRFSATTDTSEPEIEILWHDPDHADKLPLDLQLTPESLSKWLRHHPQKSCVCPLSAGKVWLEPEPSHEYYQCL